MEQLLARCEYLDLCQNVFVDGKWGAYRCAYFYTSAHYSGLTSCLNLILGPSHLTLQRQSGGNTSDCLLPVSVSWQSTHGILKTAVRARG